MDVDANGSTSSLDSFQNLLAQAVTPVSVSQPLSATSGMGWSNGIFPTIGESSIVAGTNAHIQRDRTDTATKSNSDRTNDKPASRTPSQRGTVRASSSSHAPVDLIHTNGSGSAARGTLQSVANQPEATADSNVLADASLKKAPLTSALLPPNVLPAAALSALGGTKALAGSAFAMHITPAASQNSLIASNASAANSTASATSASSLVEDITAAAGGAAISGGMNGAVNPLLPASAAQPQSTPEMLNAANPSSGQSVPWSAPVPAASTSNASLSDEPLATTVEIGEVAAEDQTGSPQPVRSLQLQLAGDGAGRVDVRLVEHAGGLSVSVRASDSALTRGLQENLPELSARLADDKYQTHTFLPPADASNNGSSSSSSDQQSGQPQEQGSRSFSQGGSNSGADPNSRQSNGQGGQQNGQQEQSAAWWRQMATLGASANHISSGQDSQAEAAANPVTNS